MDIHKIYESQYIQNSKIDLYRFSSNISPVSFFCKSNVDCKIYMEVQISHIIELIHVLKHNWRFYKRHRIDRKVGSGVLGTWVEMHNPHCFFSLSLFFKALLLVVL
jgi:hypothetical protein